ncbi:11585_t:CDS:2 [Diversispora eburnea]|uniref:NADH dehydrogenase [ubiquinone] iron-sulfur protein 4, mitochondrial n=1 Tax=Diversispora eburnea TaxID=1213867 RepID=A0A9N9AKB9_9GLOM|nr:11585_t:CDS:2 [Diversispora eburnea]
MSGLLAKQTFSQTRSLSRLSISSSFRFQQRFNSSLVKDLKEPSSKSTTQDVSHAAAPGTEPTIPAEVISGAPEELRYRTVRIYKPSKTAMQSGTHNTKHWRIDFDVLEKGDKWENPLMGWFSSADYMQALQMKFNTKEDAIHFAEKQGWDHYVQEHYEPQFRKKVYADNYKYSPGKLRIIKTK